MSKQNRWLLFLLLGLLIVTYSYYLLDQAKQRRAVVRLWPAIEMTEIDKISWNDSKGQQQMIVKQGQAWHWQSETGLPVASELSEAALAALNQLASSSLMLVSDQADKKALFGLDKPTEISLSAKDKQLAKFALGQTSALGSYVARPGEDQSYATEVDLSPWQNNDWRDKTIFDSESELWHSLSLNNQKRPGQSWLINKTDRGWFDGKRQLAEAVVLPRINALSQLSASAWPDQNLAATGLDRPWLMIKAASENLSNQLEVGNLVGNNYYVRKSGSEAIYLVDRGVIELFNSAPAAWR